jgi:hypothetical protein
MLPCEHGQKIMTIYKCKIKAGAHGKNLNGDPTICPYRWYFKDCPKFKLNNKYRYE